MSNKHTLFQGTLSTLKNKMSYESKVLRELSLPTKEEVLRTLLIALLNRNGHVKEFGSGDQDFVNQLANSIGLSERQRTFLMHTVVRKEGRLKTFPAWNRLLFRAADLAAKHKFLARPKDTLRLTGEREWMLTEKGIDEALRLSKIPIEQKQDLPILTFEVQRITEAMDKAQRLKNYNPIDTSKKSRKITRESLLRARGFRQAVLQAYGFCCCVCGLKLSSPDSLQWEVEAAHIVPHRFYGKDDLWNGIALCRFHHWTFDVGWYTLRTDFTIEVNHLITKLATDQGLMGGLDILRQTATPDQSIKLPKRREVYPHENSIDWHRKNIFVHSH